VLAASVGTRSAEIITSAALVALFVLVTPPLSTHAIGQAARWRPSGGPADEAQERDDLHIRSHEDS
jgi:multisubunit Na+/H+ antiporter MnhG subunit